MIVKQYEIAVPADYDMDTIRRRVEEKGGAFDAFSGLGLAGPAFVAIEESFGTPPVSTWPGIAFSRADALDEPRAIRSVTRELVTLPPATDLVDLVAREREAGARVVAADDGVVAHAVGLDPRRWELVRFAFSVRPQCDATPNVATYEVLHTSAPALADLRTSNEMSRCN